MKTEAGWLLILDNADDPASLEPFLPRAEHGHILITSRAQDFQDLGIIDPVELEELPSRTRPHSCSIVAAARMPRPRNESLPRDLARELDGLPLALEQAAAYIVEKSDLSTLSPELSHPWPETRSRHDSRPWGDMPSRWPPPGRRTSRRWRKNRRRPPMCCGSVPSSPRRHPVRTLDRRGSAARACPSQQRSRRGRG